MNTQESWIVIGRFGRPHGIKGFVTVHSFTEPRDNILRYTDWHAFIDGRPARLLRANVAFKGLWVPSGDSTILLRFATPRRYLFHFCFIALFAGVFIYLLLLLSKNKQTEIYA